MEPSIASVCGSIDINCTRFASMTRLQGNRVEMIKASCGPRPSLLHSVPSYDLQAGVH